MKELKLNQADQKIQDLKLKDFEAQNQVNFKNFEAT